MPKKINVKGRITSDGNAWIYDWLKIPYTSPSVVTQALEEAKGDDVEIYVNSGGGSVYDGYEIYNALREYKGNVTVKIIGLAASAASFIAMIPNAKCYMSPLSEMMIHNSSTYASGPHQAMDETSNMLQVTDSTIAQAYVLKSGMEEQEIRNLMEKETWFTASQAKEIGLIDGILFDEKPQDVNPIPTLYNAIPINDDSLIGELEKCKTVDELKAKMTENIDKLFKSSESQPTVINHVVDNKPKEGKIMTLENFKSEHANLYNQIVEDAAKQARQNERERIKAINDLAMPGLENIISEAIENGDSAEKVAMTIIKFQKEKGNQYMQQAKEDAKPMDQVENTPTPEKGNEEDQEVANMAKFGNQRRGR